MAKRNIIIIIVSVVAIIAVGLYFILSPSLKEKPEEAVFEEPEPKEVIPVAPPIERYEFQGIEYEFISVGGPVHDIVTGELTEEQVNLLAEKIIEDLLLKEPDCQKITLLFYSDLIAVFIDEPDVAEILWTPEGIDIKIIE